MRIAGKPVPQPSAREGEKPLSLWELAWRVVWMTVQLTLVFWLAQRGAFFFYQGF